MANNVNIDSTTAAIVVTLNPLAQGAGRYRFDIGQGSVFFRVFTFPDYSVYGGAPAGQEPQLLQHADFEMHVRNKKSSQNILLKVSTFTGGIDTVRNFPRIFQFNGLDNIKGFAGTAGTTNRQDIVRVARPARQLEDFDTRSAVYDLEAIIDLLVDFDSTLDADYSTVGDIIVTSSGGRTQIADANVTAPFSGTKARDIVRFGAFTGALVGINGDYYVERKITDNQIELTNLVGVAQATIDPSPPTPIAINDTGEPTMSHSRFIHADNLDTGAVSIAIDSNSQPIITATTVGAFKANVTRNGNASFEKFAVGDGVVVQQYDAGGTEQWQVNGVHNSFHIVKAIDSPGTVMTLEANDIGGSGTGIANLVFTRTDTTRTIRLIEGAFINSLNVTRPTLPSL